MLGLKFEYLVSFSDFEKDQVYREIHILCKYLYKTLKSINFVEIIKDRSPKCRTSRYGYGFILRNDKIDS